jgi:hypothetical protein
MPWTVAAPSGVGASGLKRPQSPEARLRPQGLRVVVHVERGYVLGERHPAELRARVDVDVRADRGRVVERAAAHEPHPRMGVLAEDGHLADRAAKDRLHTAVVPRHVHRLRLPREQLDPVGLDHHVDDERAPGLPLTVQAMAAVDEKRIGREAIPDDSTRAAAFTQRAHDPVISRVARRLAADRR